MTERLFDTILEISVSVSTVVLLVFLLTPLLKKRFAAKWRYWIWLVLAVRLLIPFNFHMPQPVVQISMPQRTVTVQPTVQPQTVQNAAVPTTQPPQTTVQPQLTVAGLLSVVWLMGAAVFLLFRFSGYFAFLHMVRRWSRPVREPEMREVLRLQEKELDIRRGPVFLRCKRISSPMMAGFFRPMLLLPEEDYQEEELRLILKHELIHWKRRDVWYKLLLSVANAVHWFNPIIWLMARKAGENTELVCDSEVVKGFGTDYRRRYGETILSSVRRSKICGTSFSTYFYGGAKTLKQRFANILDAGKKHRGIVTFCVVVIVLGTLSAAVACSSKAIADTVSSSTLQSSALQNSTLLSGAKEKLEKVNTADYEISVPGYWGRKQVGTSSLIFSENNQEIGWVDEANYDPSQPISQLEGNHAETLSSKKLTGLRYPAEETAIRRTQPAAANDSSYTDELHIYILPDGSRIAYDLKFDSAKVKEETALQIAGSFLLNQKPQTKAESGPAYEDVNVTSKTLCGSFGTVLCGSLKNDSKQGVAVVIWNKENSNAAPTRYLTPEKHGAIKANVSDTAHESKEDVFLVTAEDGYTWLFNLYNGFGNGHQGTSNTNSAPAASSQVPGKQAQQAGEWVVYREAEKPQNMHVKKSNGTGDRIVATDYDEGACLVGDWVYYFADLDTIRKVKVDGSQKTKVCNTDAISNLDGSTEVTTKYQNGSILIRTFQLKPVGDTRPTAKPNYYRLDLKSNQITPVKG